MRRSEGNRFSIRLTWPARVSALGLFLFLIPAAWAQLPQASDTTSPPTPGVGHDYIHAPVETVNPANGSVSIRIPVRVSSGRELTIPLSIAYDSSGAFYYGSYNGASPAYLTTTNVPFSKGGWSYTFPLMTFSEETWTDYNQQTGKPYTCKETVNYVFQDPTGNRHDMDMASVGYAAGGQYCNASDLQGGEGPILASTVDNWNTPPPVTAIDGNGTVYSFSGNLPGSFPTSITDRNGNTISISGTSSSATVTDTAGRTAINVPTFGSNPDNITVAGLASPAYKVSWTTASASFNISTFNLPGSASCPTSLSGSANVVSQIVLPNGRAYTFTYDPTYGMLNKITYPSGGYVRYVWGLNSQSEAGEWLQGSTGDWDCRYDFPAITDRYVSFDGTTEVLHQHFSYSTSWQSGSDQYTSKTTTVTTYDLVRSTNFNTIYTYSPVATPCAPDENPNGSGCAGGTFTQQMPVEQTVQYYGTSGTLLKTVGKTWCNGPRELCSATTTLNDTNQVSEITYSYNTSEQQTERDEYDYGSGGHGPLTRKTVTNYATFTGPHIVDLPSSVIVYNGSGTRVAETDSSYDQTALQSTSVVQHVAAGSTRGNLTTVTKQCFNGACAGGNPTTTYSYYDTGQIYQMTDPKGNVTTFSYTDSYSSCGGNAPPSGATNAYLTQVTYPKTGTINHIESYCYDYTAGLLRGSTDENGQTSSFTYADSLDRLTQANYPDGGQTLVSYNDAPPTPSVTTEKKLDSTGRFVTSVSITDGIGLPIETELTSDPQGTDFTATTYDGLGRAYTVTNPYRSTSDPTYGVTTYTYDALGRTTSVVKPDGSSSTVATTYSGNCTTVTDEAGKNRESCTDGLGRMTSVIENPGGLGYTTNYTYDTLDDLTAVSQGGSRSRSFNYDSLKRLTSSTNPEAGTVTYAYDLNGNVSTKTDARSITTTYTYDALNRVTLMAYSNGDQSIGYTYDQSACLGQPSCYNIGHRTRIDDVGGAEEFAYDKMGREIGEERFTGSASKTTSYAYDLAGDMTSLTYPSGRAITYTYDSAGRPSEAQDTANNINYALGTCANGISSSGVCYAPSGSVAQIKNGTNLVSTYIYNNRFQPCWMYGTTGTPLPTNTTCTAGDPGPGNILDLQYNFNLGAGDNGNVVGITNKRDSTRTQSFTYDQLNRIVTAKTSATTGSNCWGETYTIDQWANLTAIGALSGYSGCTQENLSVSATTNNQLSSTGFSYDTSGNMLNDGAHAYAYNAESEIKSAAGVNYTYDGDGNRVEKSSGKIYWYGAGTEILDESDTSGNVTNEYVFFGGKRIAMRNVSSGTIYYYEEDMLGSSRTLVQAGQTSVCYDGDFYPFGGERIVTNTCTQNYKFEGKERDTETGNDDFGARYYTSRLGRWLSADWSSVPAPVPYANLTNPQTLNLYAMVSDNPETFADLDGHCGEEALPGAPSSSQPCDNPPQNAPATTGEGNTGTGTGQSTTQRAQYTYSDTLEHQMILQQTTTTTTTDANGNTTTTTTSTTLRFSTAPGREGEFEGGNQTTTMSASDSQGHTTLLGGDDARFNKDNPDSARAAVGDAAFAQGRSAAIPSATERYVQNHKGTILIGIAEVPLVPLRFATGGYQVAKEIVEGILAAHTIWELAH
ncbi:MAG TPA: RHS repeat-associated core domain-containing protein [Candidatus Acidoferrales bacterium]|nr:RHS repeat-associated core domain-containing protein [Candidatus Acidoferrales bacterium]